MAELLVKEKNIKTREHNYDLLRIICMASVVFIHASAAGKNLFQQVILTVSGMAVPLFFMMSGAFTLSDKSILETIGHYYKQKFWKIFFPVFITSLVYILYSGILEWHLNHNPVIEIVKHLLKNWALSGIPGNGYHLWFMVVLILFYIIAPVLILLKKTHVCFYKVLFVVLFLVAETCFYFDIKFPYYISWILSIPFFMLGDFLKNGVNSIKNTEKESSNTKLIFVFSSITFFILTIEFIAKAMIIKVPSSIMREWGGAVHIVKLINDGSRSFIVVDPSRFQIFNLLATVFAFLLFKCLSVKKDITFLAEIGYYIYLVHYALEGIIRSLLLKEISLLGISAAVDSWYWILIQASVCLVLSFVVGFIFRIVVNKIAAFLNR